MHLSVVGHPIASIPPPPAVDSGDDLPPLDNHAASATGGDPPPCYELELKVTDSGIGIDQKHLQGLFKSFSQVQHASGEYGGTVRSTYGCTQGASLLC